MFACDKDPILREKIREACKRDIIFWINGFCYTKDPKKPLSKIPFVIYDSFQREGILDLVKAINTGEDRLVEKTRDMGASWIVLYVFIWFWLFHDNCDFRIGSRKEDFVDKIGDMDTLMEKVRFTLRFLPSWMKPAGYVENDHATYMRIVNPVNKNTIIGESANPHFGSGGRRKAILLDEFAKWETSVADAAWTSTHDVTRCRIVVSTPVGSANKFALLAKGTKEKIKKLTLHWSLHPDKAKDAYYLNGEEKIPITDPKRAFELWKSGVKVRSPWYDAECERRSEQDVAQELDIDYLKSGRPFFSLKELKLQREWQYYARKDPYEPIKWGFYVTVNLVDIDGRIEMRESPDGWLRIYELPQSWCAYVAAADISEGLPKGDESFGVVRSKITRNLCAYWSGLYKPEDMAIKLSIVSRFFNDADRAPENNGPGYTTCRDSENLPGGKLYYTRREVDGQVTNKRGFTTSGNNRRMMLDQADEEIRQMAAEVRSPFILKEMETFVHNAKTGKPEADGEFLDDGVMAWSICGQVIQEQPFEPKNDYRDEGTHIAIEEARLKRRNAGYGFGRK